MSPPRSVVVPSDIPSTAGAMSVYRTPDDRFSDLPGFPFEPHYVEVGGLRVHYVDEGEGAPVLCLHGEPTWSYLYRKMIPPMAARHRVLAMDFVGFGRSDKLTDSSAYSFGLHADTLRGFLEALDLTGVTLVVQDWGGLIGLAVAAAAPDRFARLVIMNTFLPTGEEAKTPAFLQWRQYVARNPDLPVGRIVQRGTAHPERMPPAVVAAYDAPFPTAASKAGAAVWPLLVPMMPDDPVAAVMRETQRLLAAWMKPAFVLFAPGDPILGQAHAFFRRLLPTAAAQPEVFIDDASHFLQEEQGAAIAAHLLAFIDRT